MTFKTRIARSVAVATLAVSGTIALAPAVSATVHGPGDIAIPTPCTHGCNGGGGGVVGPDDFKAPEPGPVVDPSPNPTPNPDQPIVVAHASFTG